MQTFYENGLFLTIKVSVANFNFPTSASFYKKSIRRHLIARLSPKVIVLGEEHMETLPNGEKATVSNLMKRQVANLLL